MAYPRVTYTGGDRRFAHHWRLFGTIVIGAGAYLELYLFALVNCRSRNRHMIHVVIEPLPD